MLPSRRQRRARNTAHPPLTPRTRMRTQRAPQPTETNDPPQQQSPPQANDVATPTINDKQLNTMTEKIITRVINHFETQPKTIPIYDVNNEGSYLTSVTDLTNNDDMQIESIHSDLGQNIPNRIKSKIINDEYIEIGCLLRNKTDDEDESKRLAIRDGTIVIDAKKENTKITNISQWTDAFIIFFAIYVTAHPTTTSALLKYMRTVRLGAKRSPGLGWVDYDRQFRLKRETNASISWDVVDPELWLIYMFKSGLSQSTSNPIKNVMITILKAFVINKIVCMHIDV